jgi:hypothetical protein
MAIEFDMLLATTVSPSLNSDFEIFIANVESKYPATTFLFLLMERSLLIPATIIGPIILKLDSVER